MSKIQATGTYWQPSLKMVIGVYGAEKKALLEKRRAAEKELKAKGFNFNLRCKSPAEGEAYIAKFPGYDLVAYEQFDLVL